MAQSDILKRYLDAGMAFTQLTRTRAEGIVKELVRAGEVRRERTQEAIDDLVERSRRNTEALVTMVRKEVSSQLSQVGVATKLDLSRLERRLGLGGKKAAPKKAPAKKAPAKKAATKKAPAKKAATKKAPAKKAAAKKAPAAKAPAAKAPAPSTPAPAVAPPPQQTAFEAPPATTSSFGFGTPLTPPSGGSTEQG